MLEQNLEFDLGPKIIFEKREWNAHSQAIHDLAKKRAKNYLLSEAEMLRSVMDADKDQTYKCFGHEYLTPYCVQELGLAEEVAGNFVRVARRSLQVPELGKAVEAGLSLSKAKAIASALTPTNQADLIGKAQALTRDKLEDAVAIAAPQQPKGEKSKKVGENRNRVEFELSDEELVMQRRAQDLASQKLGRSASYQETQRYLLKIALHQKDPVQKAERAAKRDRPRGRSSESKPGQRIVLPAATIHAVNRRDQGACQAQGPNGGGICGRKRWVHHHHVIPLSKGGSNDVANLITLCSAHHRLLHLRD